MLELLLLSRRIHKFCIYHCKKIYTFKPFLSNNRKHLTLNIVIDVFENFS